MNDHPFALHITWTCYASWLPGDARGYVSNTLLPERGFLPKQNVPGTPCTADDATTRGHARALQRHPTACLTEEHARCVAMSLIDAARQRQWRILRAAIMANHVHVVITACPDDGPTVRRILKGVSDAALRQQFPGQGRWWTAGGSDRYKHDWPAIEAAVQYVKDQEHILSAIDDMQIV
ncbi:MAG: hypothetical protein ACK4RK_22195 [Gemmataceae bacterium]